MKAYADQRHDLHEDHVSSRPLSENYELVGLMGELALSQLTGLAPDLAVKPGGDGGTDSHLYLRYTVDVKTARKPYNLIHEQGKSFADIFVLARYVNDATPAELLGWEWGARLMVAPVRDFGYGVMSHYIPAGMLRPIGELSDRALRL